MTPLERAREFCEGAFGPLGVNTEPYAELVAELIEGAEEQLRAENERLRAALDDCIHGRRDWMEKAQARAGGEMSEKTSYSCDGPKCPACGFTFTPDENYYYDSFKYTKDECQECGCKFDVEVTSHTSWACRALEGK